MRSFAAWRSRLSLVVLAFASSVPSVPARAAAEFVVGVASGELKGKPRVSGGAEFLGIPYAAAPIGELRWHDPVPAKPWTEVRDATAFGAPCAQAELGDWNKHDSENSS